MWIMTAGAGQFLSRPVLLIIRLERMTPDRVRPVDLVLMAVLANIDGPVTEQCFIVRTMNIVTIAAFIDDRMHDFHILDPFPDIIVALKAKFIVQFYIFTDLEALCRLQ